MKRNRMLVLVAILVAGFAIPTLAQAQARIAQPIVINGQQANGAYVSAPGGAMQTFTCDDPQQYTTADGAAQGWACYESTTGVWLLNAIPPSAAQAPAAYPSQPNVVYQTQPNVIYQQPPVVYAPAPVVVYPAPVRPVVVAPYYPPSVVLGSAAINAAGRIISAAIARPTVIARAPVIAPVVVRPRVEVRRVVPSRTYVEHSHHHA
jgi:hypothetical protein